MTEDSEISAAVLLIRDYVNTREPQVGSESFSDPDQLQDWFMNRGLLSPGARLGQQDLELALAVREGLRDVLLGHHGDHADSDARAELNAVLAQVPVRLTFGDFGLQFAAATGAPIRHAVAGLLDAVRRSTEESSWPNLKVCARDSCRWAFYDSSRNHARRWCSMAGCGNHVKMQRAYANRKRRGATGPANAG